MTASPCGLVASGLRKTEELLADDKLSQAARTIVEAVLAVAPAVATSLQTLDAEYQPARMCLEASRLAQRLLATRAISVDLLEGDIVLRERESLEHFVLLGDAGQDMVVVDFTASQLPWFSDDPVLGVTASEHFPEFLRHNWHWFLPGSLAPLPSDT